MLINTLLLHHTLLKLDFAFGTQHCKHICSVQCHLQAVRCPHSWQCLWCVQGDHSSLTVALTVYILNNLNTFAASYYHWVSPDVKARAKVVYNTKSTTSGVSLGVSTKAYHCMYSWLSPTPTIVGRGFCVPCPAKWHCTCSHEMITRIRLSPTPAHTAQVAPKFNLMCYTTHHPSEHLHIEDKQLIELDCKMKKKWETLFPGKT